MQKWKVCLTFESEGNILMESKLYILEGNKMKNRLEEIRGAWHPTGGTGAGIGGFASDHRLSGKREI